MDCTNLTPFTFSDKIKTASDQSQLVHFRSYDFLNIDNKFKNIIQKQLNFNDLFSWPNINDTNTTLLIEHGPKYGKNSDFSYSENFEQEILIRLFFLNTPKWC